ncbi:hypothetical protein [Sulfuracidifex tepidarius]|uniref:Uncharacterized protein n=1 Tax=Sulfuracidifex tepidarius TaxID=1294262 RepID=A0A510DV25_9CREN|nr:hypothetical protein [Sulfuracidifex tepidarius]BBG24086.1 hypothetical protein IC006_1387 [Sulfuracidifex tepidarius]BBG26841.1 hypothetical protein IC007_1362 [Sulfuracidifex tepidarius]
MSSSYTTQKFFAIGKIDTLDVPEEVTLTGDHRHISGAVDEAIDRLKEFLRREGMKGKFTARIEVFVKDEENSNLVESIKTRISI